MSSTAYDDQWTDEHGNPVHAASAHTIVDTAAPLPPIDTHPDAQHSYTEAQMRMYWCDGAGYAMARMQEREAPALVPLTREQIEAIMTEHYPLDSLLRENVDAFEECIRDVEAAHGIKP